MENSVEKEVKLPLISRPWRLISFILVVGVLLAASFYTGSRLKTPESSALETATRDVVVSAAVEKRIVSGPITLPGSVTAGAEMQLAAEPPSNAERLVVTAMDLTPAQNIFPGTLVGAVSGRPIIVMDEAIPFYRVLKKDDTGADVAALQVALAGLGYNLYPSEKVDEATLSVIRSMYSTVGYTPPGGLKDTFIDWREFMQIPGNQGTVRQISAVGDVLSTELPLATIQTSPNTVVARASVLQAEKFRSGAQVRLKATSHDISASVAQVSEFIPANPQTGEGAGMDITVALPPDQLDLLEPNTPVTITTMETQDAEMACPLTALRQDEEGTYVILVQDGDISEHTDETTPTKIYVQVRSQAGGWAAIEPNDKLPEGQKIVVSQ